VLVDPCLCHKHSKLIRFMFREISVIELILMRGKIHLLGRGSLMCHGILRYPGAIFSRWKDSPRIT
jgi:hypothetical protein